MLKATVVSICPFEISQTMPGLLPPQYRIAKPKKGDFELATFHKSFYLLSQAGVDHKIKVDVQAEEIAQAFVNDYNRACMGFEPGKAEPGLFWVEGEVKKEEALKSKTFSGKLAQARNLQKAWFVEQVRLADDDWAEFRKHSFISEVQRHAAEVLNLQREWLVQIPEPTEPVKVQNCPACFIMIPQAAIICPNCRIILDAEKFKKFKVVS